MHEVAIKVLKVITDAGFKAYIVGGYPRDLYLGKTSVDVDICTNATPKEIKELFNDSVMPKQQYGGVTIVVGDIHFEITTFRKEIKYENNRFPVKIKYIDTLVDDLERRDFTINTLCLDDEGKYLDLLNAKKDIDSKIIKTVGNSDTKIKTDILRSLRAIRFATILNFELEESLKKSIKKYGYLLKKLSYYRKKDELDKIFSSPNASYGISLIKELELEKHLEINLDDIILTTSSLAIWAQLNVVSKYNFSNHEKDIINDVNNVLDLDLLDNHVLYKYGLYVCTLAGEIKQIDRKLIVEKYNELAIKDPNEIVIKGDDICNILNIKPSNYIKIILSDIENKIIDNELTNDLETLKEYVLANY